MIAGIDKDREGEEIPEDVCRDDRCDIMEIHPPHTNPRPRKSSQIEVCPTCLTLIRRGKTCNSCGWAPHRRRN